MPSDKMTRKAKKRIMVRRGKYTLQALEANGKGIGILQNHITNDASVHVGETQVAAAVAVCEFLVVHTQQM